ncbi:MAG: TMEM198/TM7SF3 family protein [Dorea sp.]|nr:TMEM198/TM7SF3 family protein [Dorea sp.]
MNEVVTRIDQITGTGMLFLQNMTVLIVAIVIGLMIGLFGLKLVRVWAAFMGFLLGAAAGGGIASGANLSEIASVGVMLGGALLMAVLACVFYKVGIFFYMIFLVTGLCVLITKMSTLPVLGISLVLGLIVAIITVKVFDPLVIIVTSISGGFMTGSAIVSMVGLDENIIAVIAVPLVLIILCMCVQFIMRSRQVGRKQEEIADEKRQQISRETEVEKARLLLDDDLEDDISEEELDDFDFDEDDYSEDELEEKSDLDIEDDLEEDDDFRIIE